MLAADRAHTSLPEFMTWAKPWQAMYRAAVTAERRADHEIRVRDARRAAQRRAMGKR